jgi:hypothetical protein
LISGNACRLRIRKLRVWIIEKEFLSEKQPKVFNWRQSRRPLGLLGAPAVQTFKILTSPNYTLPRHPCSFPNSHLSSTCPCIAPVLPLHLLSMVETPRRIRTRTTNAGIHPGDIVNASTRKRRTKAQIAADSAAKAAQEAAKKKVVKDNFKRVSDLEKSISKEDANESTPRPRPHPRQAAPSQTRDNVKIPLYADESDQGMDDDDLGDTTADGYKPETDVASVLVSQEDDTEDSVTKDQPLKKKQKRVAERGEINFYKATSRGGDSESTGGKPGTASDKGPKATSGPGSNASTCVVIFLTVNHDKVTLT